MVLSFTTLSLFSHSSPPRCPSPSYYCSGGDGGGPTGGLASHSTLCSRCYWSLHSAYFPRLARQPTAGGGELQLAPYRHPRTKRPWPSGPDLLDRGLNLGKQSGPCLASRAGLVVSCCSKWQELAELARLVSCSSGKGMLPIWDSSAPKKCPACCPARRGRWSLRLLTAPRFRVTQLTHQHILHKAYCSIIGLYDNQCPIAYHWPSRELASCRLRKVEATKKSFDADQI